MKKISVLLVLIITLISCNDATTITENDDDNNNDVKEVIYKVSGKIQNPNNRDIPPDAKVVIAWAVTVSAEDHVFVWGEGDIDWENMTFLVEFKDYPPTLACTNMPPSSLGAGFILLVDKDFPTGKISSHIEEPVIGFVSNRAIIYIEGEKEDLTCLFPWVTEFNYGYNLGNGIYADNHEESDSWEPNSEPENLLIDLWGNENHFKIPYGLIQKVMNQIIR